MPSAIKSCPKRRFIWIIFADIFVNNIHKSGMDFSAGHFINVADPKILLMAIIKTNFKYRSHLFFQKWALVTWDWLWDYGGRKSAIGHVPFILVNVDVSLNRDLLVLKR